MADIFANTSSEEAASGKTEYAAFMFKTHNGSDTGTAVKVWLLSNTPSADTVDTIGIGTSGVDGVEQTISDKNTAPAGVSFETAIDEANCLNLPDLEWGNFHAIWVKRVTSGAASAIGVDNSVIRTKMDSPV